MSQPPAKLLDAAQLARAVPENIYAFFRTLQAIPGSELVESEKLSYHHALPSNPMFKGVWASHLSAEECEPAIGEMRAWFQQRGAPYFFWWTDSQTQPADLAQRLLLHGFDGNLVGDPGMAADLDALNLESSPAPGFAVKPVTSQEMLEAWRDVFIASYSASLSDGQGWVDATNSLGLESAPWVMYTGYQDGVPAATSLLFAGAGVAGIYAVGTLHHYRGKGFGAAVTLKAMTDARNLGYRYAVLFSSQMGYSVYRRIGFREVDCRIGIYYLELNG